MCFDVFWRCVDFFVFQVRVLGCGRAWLGNRTRDRVLRRHEAYQLSWGGGARGAFFLLVFFCGEGGNSALGLGIELATA